MATSYTDGTIGASLINCGGNAVSVSSIPVAGALMVGESGTSVGFTDAGTSGDILQSRGSTDPVWVKPYAASNKIFSSTTSVTYSNLTTTISLFGAGVGSLTIPANTLVAGSVIKITMVGFISRAAASSITYLLTLGGNTVATNTIATTTNATNESLIITALITCRTAGAGGNGIGNLNAASSIYGTDGTNTNAVFSLDTTISRVLNLTFRYSVANLNNAITITNSTVELFV